jgi:hypothetical protein
MKGMTLEQFAEVTRFVQKYHAFAKANYWKEGRVEEAISDGILPELSKYGLNIKYVRCDYDTRFGDVWGITLDNVRFATNHFTSFNPAPKQWKYDNIYDLTMAYLKGEFKPKKEFYIER